MSSVATACFSCMGRLVMEKIHSERSRNVLIMSKVLESVIHHEQSHISLPLLVLRVSVWALFSDFVSPLSGSAQRAALSSPTVRSEMITRPPVPPSKSSSHSRHASLPFSVCLFPSSPASPNPLSSWCPWTASEPRI